MKIYYKRFQKASSVWVYLFLMVPFLLFAAENLTAQPVTVKGKVWDASTNEPLMAATVQIRDTYRGTITNADGEFEIRVPEFPVAIVVRFIGYSSLTIEIPEPTDEILELRLSPVTVIMPELTVGREDPALRIMREVIARKPIWRDALESYHAEAYSRQRLENDTGIVSITESLSSAYWDRRRGTREVIHYRQQTSNLDATQNFANATFVPNFYDDNITISGFDLVGVTHPNALSYYHFRLEGFRQIDDKTVFDIAVWPRRRLQPTFEGMISVLDEDFALIEVDLRPGESVMFPPPIQEFGLWYRQQFSNFGGDFWLPVDVRIEGTIKIGFPGLQFPPINFFQLSRLSNYEVNIPLPDSLFEIQRRILVDTLRINNPSARTIDRSLAIPLDDRESTAYEKLDSTMTMEKAFSPTGALSRFVDMGDEDEKKEPGPLGRFFGKAFNGVTPLAGYNRVDGGRFGLKYSPPVPFKVKPFVSGTYLGATQDWNYGLGAVYRFRDVRRNFWGLEASHYNETRNRWGESMFSPLMSAPVALLGGNDYFDYYNSRKTVLTTTFRKVRTSTRFRLDLASESYNNLEKATNYSIPGGYIQRVNPSVDEGIDNSVSLTISRGSNDAAFGVTGGNNVKVTLSQGLAFAGGDFNYTKVYVEANRRFETFYKRRFLPNTLDMKLVAGGAMGDLPLAKWYVLDTRLSYFTPFGAFKTNSGIPYEGEQAVAFFWEHNFRTIPFEALGLSRLAKKGVGIIAFGGHGYAWSGRTTFPEAGWRPNQTSRPHHEVGISVNSIFSLFRFDAAFRVDQPGLYAGVSVARIF